MLVRMSMFTDYSRLLQSLCSWPCTGQMISFSHVQVPTAVQVLNVGSISQERLQLYFEHTKSSGGGDIKQLTVNEQHGYAIIEFCDQQGSCFSISSLNKNAIVVFELDNCNAKGLSFEMPQGQKNKFLVLRLSLFLVFDKKKTFDYIIEEL